MLKRIFVAAAAAAIGWTAQAEHAVAPEQAQQAAEAHGDLVPAITREICTTVAWGDDLIRTDCRETARAMPAGNPALKGICTIYYGVRSCY